MYLSTLLVDTGDQNADRPRPGRLWLRNVYHVHQRLSMAFPSREQLKDDPLFLKPYDPESFVKPKFLFRIDRGVRDDSMRTVILVQSAYPPDWKYAFQNASGLVEYWETREMALEIAAGMFFRFRLLANPTVKRNGKRFPCWLPNEDERNRQEKRDFQSSCRAWLNRKAEQHGFRIQQLEIERASFMQGVKRDYSDNRKQNEYKLNLAIVRFDGVLEVIEPTQFQNALADGIGSGKGFGCGLLSVLRFA